jgi:DNA-binding beta-propeller fold protein YncE
MVYTDPIHIGQNGNPGLSMNSLPLVIILLAAVSAAQGAVRYCEIHTFSYNLKDSFNFASDLLVLSFALAAEAPISQLPDPIEIIETVSFGPCPDAIPALPPPFNPTGFARRLSALAAGTPVLAYITDSGFNVVHVVNLSTRTVQSTIRLPGTGAPNGISITPDGKFLWVCESLNPPGANASELEIIDTSSLRIVSSIPLGPLVSARWIAISPDGKTAYVTNNGLGQLGTSGAVNSILVIDVATRKLTGQILPPLLNPQRPEFGSASFRRLAVSPDGTLLYAVSDLGIFVFDTLTNTQVNPPPSSLALVNISTFNVPGVTPTPDTRIVFHPNGTRAYFTSGCPPPDGGSACLMIMDTKTNLLIDRVVLGPRPATEPTGLGISANGGVVFVKEFNSGDIIAVDTKTGAVRTRSAGKALADGMFLNRPLQ